MVHTKLRKMDSSKIWCFPTWRDNPTILIWNQKMHFFAFIAQKTNLEMVMDLNDTIEQI